jgi:hypothetical protein
MSGETIAALMVRDTMRRTLTSASPAPRTATGRRRAAARALQRIAHRLDPQVVVAVPQPGH